MPYAAASPATSAFHSWRSGRWSFRPAAHRTSTSSAPSPRRRLVTSVPSSHGCRKLGRTSWPPPTRMSGKDISAQEPAWISATASPVSSHAVWRSISPSTTLRAEAARHTNIKCPNCGWPRAPSGASGATGVCVPSSGKSLSPLRMQTSCVARYDGGRPLPTRCKESRCGVPTLRPVGCGDDGCGGESIACAHNQAFWSCGTVPRSGTCLRRLLTDIAAAPR